MNCGPQPLAVKVPHYSLSRIALTHTAPTTLTVLGAWLHDNSPNGCWRGKIYVASTISWDGKQNTFVQRGCSPNYMAGWWSLTCCKHDMRSGGPLRRVLAQRNSEAVFIFTLAEQDEMNRQGLVSVAKMTEHFPDMQTYARRILSSRDGRLISSRLSRRRQNDDLFGWRFGDCHANRSGEVGAPHPEHEHGKNRAHCWDRDNTPGHELLLSDCFKIWPTPVFFSKQTLKQSRYGLGLNGGTLSKLLR